MNILSLFDGISCGQVALERANIQVDKYYASEIDKYAIKITQKNYPNTTQLGDINNWETWNLPNIDLLIGGSPCQGFSIAGQKLNFDDPRSKLFFKYVDILKYYKPKYFLLENVKMKKEWQDIISGYLGVKPIEINSALVSAQNRKRLYWTNIPNIQQPEDKYIYLKDIIEDIKEINKKNTWISGAAIRNQVTKNGVEEQLNIRKDEKSNCVVSSYSGKLNGLIQVGMATNINGHDILKRIYSIYGKCPTLFSMQGGNTQPKIAISDLYFRPLTVIECERLQTLVDNYTEGVSNSQRYKGVGNGWTVDVIAYILSFIN